jgi:hypothetical protein
VLVSFHFYYQIRMPSGTYVTVQIYCWGYCMLNIAVYPVADDATLIEGLCGNANGDWSDDLQLRNSTVRDVILLGTSQICSQLHVSTRGAICVLNITAP